jgi:hypothetical protein
MLLLPVIQIKQIKIEMVLEIVWNSEFLLIFWSDFLLVLDIDKDGIKDSDDLCPTIPETWNGINDYDGCPELGMEAYCDNNSFAKGPTDFNF